MFIVNFAELVADGTLSLDNYCLCGFKNTKKLLSMGFIPLAQYNNKYVFTKDETILKCLKERW